MTDSVEQHLSYGRNALLVQIPALFATVVLAFIFQQLEFTEVTIAMLGLSMGAFFTIGIWSWLLIVRAVRRRESFLKWLLALVSQLCLSVAAGYYVWHHIFTTSALGFLGVSLYVLAIGVPVVSLGGLAVVLSELLFHSRLWLRRSFTILTLIAVVAPAGFFTWFLLIHIEIGQIHAKTNPYEGLFKVVHTWMHDAALDVFDTITTMNAARASHISLVYGYHSDAKLLSFLPDENGHVAGREQNYTAGSKLLTQNPNAFIPHFRDLLNPETPRYKAYASMTREWIMQTAGERIDDAQIRAFLKRQPLSDITDHVDTYVLRGISMRPFIPLMPDMEAYLRRHAATSNSWTLARFLMSSVEYKKNKEQREALRELWLRMLGDSDSNVRLLVASSIGFCEDFDLFREVSEAVLKTNDLPMRRKLLHSGAMYSGRTTPEMYAWLLRMLLAETENGDAYCRFAAALSLHTLLDIQAVKRLPYQPNHDVYNPEPETDETREYVRKVRMFALERVKELKE